MLSLLRWRVTEDLCGVYSGALYPTQKAGDNKRGLWPHSSRTPYALNLASILVSFYTRQYSKEETNIADLETVIKALRQVKTFYWSNVNYFLFFSFLFFL